MKSIEKEIVKFASNRRNFLKLITAAAFTTATVGTVGCTKKSSAKAKIVVIGGGAAGISTASKLLSLLESPDITIIDPSDLHFYQPGFTLIAGGVYSKDDVYLQQKDCIPSGAKWLKDSVVLIEPTKNKIFTLKNGTISYDFLVLTPGLQINWNALEGISRETLGTGDAHCLYDYNGAQKTWQGVQKFAQKGGYGIFTDTYTKHKCGGAPKKICLLTEHLSRKNGTRANLNFDFFTASKQLYNVPHFTPRLLEIYKERNVPITTRVKVKGIDTSAKKAYFTKTEVSKDASGKEIKTTTSFTKDYDFMHFLPPMGAPDFVIKSGLSAQTGERVAEGWVDTDKETFVHKRFNNIVVLGDVANIPTSKTSAAIRKQYPIAAQNLVSIMEGKAPEIKYDGYAACPIITDYGHVLMCEFDYNKKEAVSFPLSMLDMSKESRIAWLLKVYALKPMYFYGMLNALI